MLVVTSSDTVYFNQSQSCSDPIATCRSRAGQGASDRHPSSSSWDAGRQIWCSRVAGRPVSAVFTKSTDDIGVLRNVMDDIMTILVTILGLCLGVPPVTIGFRIKIIIFCGS